MERLRRSLVDGDAADAVADAAGAVPEGAGEEGLPHADGTPEDDVLLLGQPVQAERARGRDLEGGGLEIQVTTKQLCAMNRDASSVQRTSHPGQVAVNK
jgi:hypothetical protein